MRLSEIFESKDSKVSKIIERLLDNKHITAREASLILSRSQMRISIQKIEVEASSGAKIIGGDNTDYES